MRVRAVAGTFELHVSWVFQLGFALYGLNLAVGLAARFGGARFGLGHHLLYAAVVLSSLAAAVWAFHPALLLTLVALALIPIPSARSDWHPTLAVLGLAGYLAAALVSPHGIS